MAEKDLIGFDPLAWMDGADDTDKVVQQPKEQVVVKQVAEPSIEESAPAVEETAAETIVELIVENVNESDSTDDSKLTLEATLNIQNVSDLYEKLLVLLENQEKIEIDASGVASIDTTTLQVLTVLKRTAIKSHKEVIFDFPSDKFIESAELLGLAEILEVDQAAAGFF